MNTFTTVLNSAAEYPKHRANAGAGDRAKMRCKDGLWLIQPGFDGDGGGQPRGVFRDGAV